MINKYIIKTNKKLVIMKIIFYSDKFTHNLPTVCKQASTEKQQELCGVI